MCRLREAEHGTNYCVAADAFFSIHVHVLVVLSVHGGLMMKNNDLQYLFDPTECYPSGSITLTLTEGY
jgi:hypothetical protein